jgi:preprotein translocase subunit YajC
MPSLLDALPLLFAQNAPPPAGAGDGDGSPNVMLYMMIGIVVFWFYFLLIRPQQRQEKQRRTMMDALKKNDRVLTSAGIYGTVVSVDAESDRVVVRVDDDRGVKVAFTKASIARVLDGSTEKDKEKEKAAGSA